MPECPECGKPFDSSAISSDSCPHCSAPIRTDSALPAPRTGISSQSSNPRSHIPWLTLLLAFLIVATYLLQMFAARSKAINPLDPVLLALGMQGAAVFAGQWWRLVTTIFVHIDLFHLISNLCFLLLFGSIAEWLFPRPSYLSLWFLTGIAGSLSQLASLSPRSYGYGASGVAFGLVGALWSAYCVNRVPTPRAVGRWSIPILLGIFLILGFLPDWLYSHSFNSAHVGGMLAGMILGLVLPTRTTPTPARRLCAILAIAAVLFAACARLAHARQEPLLELFAIEDAHPDLLHTFTLSIPETSRLQEIVTRHPDLTPAQLLLARIYFRQERYDDAIREYLPLVAAHPQQPELWNEMGHAFLNARRYSEASAALSRYLELISATRTADEQNAHSVEIQQALSSLALACESAGEIDKAIQVNRKILQVDPQNVAAQYNLDRLLTLAAAPANSNPQPLPTPPPPK